jgi:hypothetical protein
VPPPEACDAERDLHCSLLRNPGQLVAASQIAAIADGDVREIVAWRDHLMKHPTLEAAYLEMIRHNLKFPYVLIGQLVQAVLRNVLDDCDDVFALRAAEMFFRPQKLTVQEGSVKTAIDEEMESLLGSRPHSPLMELLGLPATAEVDILSDTTAGSYWERSDRFDMVLDLTVGQPGLVAPVRRWLWHLLAIDIAIEPLAELHNARLSWYVGLSSDATRIGDAIWNGGDLDDAMRARLVGMFRLIFHVPRI